MQRYFASEKKNNNLILYDSDIHHIKKVMRMKIDDEIEVVYNKQVYLCKITNFEPFAIDVICEKDENNELDIEVVIAIGLVQEQKFDLILQKLTELGVSKIIPLKMERSIVKLDDKKEQKKLVRWQTICKEASEQSHRNVIPEVTEVMTLKELVKQQADLKLVCCVNQEENLINNYLQNLTKYAKMIIVIGPEGGISLNEEKFLNYNNFESISLGKRVLRVETAAFYVASVISNSSMR